MSGAKYIKISDSVEAIHVPEGPERNEIVTFSKKRCPREKFLVAAVFLIVLVVAVVFIALYARQVSKKETSGKQETYKSEEEQRKVKTTAGIVQKTTRTPSAELEPAATTAKTIITPTQVSSCLSQNCVLASAG